MLYVINIIKRLSKSKELTMTHITMLLQFNVCIIRYFGNVKQYSNMSK